MSGVLTTRLTPHRIGSPTVTSPEDNPTPPTQKTYSIYCLTNTVNGKRYVGQTSQQLKNRWTGHVSDANNARLQIMGKYCRYLCAAIRKYGRDAFSVQISETVSSREEANIREAFWIKRATDVSAQWVHLCVAATVKEMSEETRLKLSAATAGENKSSIRKENVRKRPKGKSALAKIQGKNIPLVQMSKDGKNRAGAQREEDVSRKHS